MAVEEEAPSGLRAVRIEPAATEPLLISNGDEHLGDAAACDGGCSGNSLVLVSTLIAVCGSYAFGNALGYSSPAETGIVNELGLSLVEYSVFGSALTIGAMFGAVLSGRIADIIGRRGAMWVAETLCITGWLAIIFAKNALCLDLGRLLGGCGIGLLSYVLMIGIGKAIMYLIGSLVGWRVLAAIGTIPSLIQVIGLFFIPESPRWLAKVGREKEFKASLQRLRGKNADISQEASDIMEYTEKLHSMSEGGIMELFQRKYAHALVVGIGLMIFQQLGGLNGFVFYTSAIFEAAGFSASIGNIIAAVVQIVGTTSGVVLVDKLGRRALLLTSAAGTCLGCLFTGLSFFFQDLNFAKELVSSLVLVGVLVFLGSFELGMGGLPWVIMSEVFPINIKGSAGSLVNLVSWLGSWAVSYTYNFLFEWSSAGMAPCLLQLLGLFFVPESPRWLVGVGLMVVQQFSGLNGHVYYLSSILEKAGVHFRLK
ncbi:hypothetical protein CDL15_Pgr019020 [Punica granatum]|uniref:Major facilitator superfamily (MFS) profile domain-containing protein n=1 Tax=Punica granatum TaxID=22663 RepID=A0A218XL28_PUNGR|nr:hypothetical protein CDL15_Pgr019020 [Punica granatum]